RLARGDAEEGGLELVDGIEESAPARHHLAGCPRRGIQACDCIPTIGWHLAYCIYAIAEQVPEGFGARGAGEPACQADDGYRGALAAGELPLQRLILGLELLDS